MTDTLREVGPHLWVGSKDEAHAWAELFDEVIDCLGGEGPQGAYAVIPTGRSAHAWTSEDLERITKDAKSMKGEVLVHCRAGKSRSACVAAAILLDRGEAASVEDALKAVCLAGRRMNSHSVAGLRRWWDSRQQMPLFGR